MWRFIQEQILGMKWLNEGVGKLLSLIGIDMTTRLGGAFQFFFYDVIKITILLCVLIFSISYIQSYFPPERSRKILSRFDGYFCQYCISSIGDCYSILFLFFHSTIYGFYQCRTTHWCDFLALISSPMVDLGSLILLMSIFGTKIAFIYVLFGLVIAVLGGTFIEKLGMEKYVEDFVKNAHVPFLEEENLTFRDRVNFAKEQVSETFKKVFPYILIGVGIGAFIHNWIPENWVTSTLEIGIHSGLS